MIEGLKVTVWGPELREIAQARAAYHEERRQVYAGHVEEMEASRVEGVPYTGGDPIKTMRDKAQEHEAQAGELRFIAAHIDLKEFYLLDRDALYRLGIVANRY